MISPKDAPSTMRMPECAAESSSSRPMASMAPMAGKHPFPLISKPHLDWPKRVRNFYAHKPQGSKLGILALSL